MHKNIMDQYARMLALLALPLSFAMALSQAGTAFGGIPTEPLLTQQERLHFSLALSGGISLGTYEAGVNWASIKHLRNIRDCNEHPDLDGQCVAGQLRSLKSPDILSISGASAGSVNALLSAVAWCIDERLVMRNGSDVPNDVGENIFKDTWLAVGIEELLPPETKQDGGRYKKNDLLFSRKAFDSPLQNIKNLLDRPIFRRDCDVPLALTLSRIIPEKIITAGISVSNSRFTLPLRLVADPDQEGKIRIISNIVDPIDPYWGNIIYLPGRKTVVPNGSVQYILDLNKVIDAILASSSYPLAFGNTRMPYCIQNKPIRSGMPIQESIDQCPEGYALQSQGDNFIDGGVFDNVPLGVAKALAEPLGEQKELPYCVHYIDISPGNLRDLSSGGQAVASNVTGTQQTVQAVGLRHNLLTQLDFLEGAIKTGINYELYNVLRSGDWNHRMTLFVDAFVDILKVSQAEIESYLCTPAQPDCDTLFDNLPHNLMDSKNGTARKQVAACLRNKAAALENAFMTKEVVFSMQPQKLRTQLITWLTKLNKTNIHKDAETEKRLQRHIDLAAEDNGGERTVLLSSRYSRITGDYLIHFGAFLDRQFRAFDYYTGIYDAVYGIANFRCQGACDPACLSAETRNLYRELGIGMNRDAARVFLCIAEKEHPEYWQQDGPWNWIEQEPAGEDLACGADSHQNAEPMDILFQTLQDPRSDPDARDGFPNFLRIIKDKGYAYAAGSTLDQMLQRSDKSPLSIYYPLSARMSVRLRDIVADDQGAEDAKWLSAGTRAALLAANTLIDNEQPLDWTRATVPPDQSKLWYVLPHELSVNVVNGGALLSWEPRVNWNDLRSLNFKITPYVPDSSDDKVFRMSQLDVYYTEKRKYETISSWGVGPSVYFPWDSYQKPTGILNHVGASAYVGIIGDKFRMTIGWRNIHASDYPAPSHNFYLLLGVTDIPGISYWFFSK